MKNIEQLTQIHRRVLNNLTNEAYGYVRLEMESMKDTNDIGELKIVLVLTKAFKEHSELKDIRSKLLTRYELLITALKANQQ